MPGHEEGVGDAAEDAERRAPFDNVAHQRAAGDDVKLVLVTHGAKGAADHLVDEAARGCDLGNARDELLPDSEVAGLEGDEVAQLQQSVEPSRRHQSLAGEGGRLGVYPHVTRQIEAELYRRGDQSFDDDLAHESFSVAVRFNTRCSAVESGSTQK